MVKREKKSKKYFAIATFVIAILVGGYLIYSSHDESQSEKSKVKEHSSDKSKKSDSTTGIEGDTVKNKSTAKINRELPKENSKQFLMNEISLGKGVQKIDHISDLNGDCTNPILVTDSIVFSPQSPKGSGKSLEINNNKPDDLLHFEKEHNTVWYRFVARESGSLTFDIIPLDQNDDYDFMLFKYNGPDLCTRVVAKTVTPLRTCISRNDKKLESRTGLTLDEFADTYVHSGTGSSYVKYIHVEKGEVYYLILDNVNNSGKGHILHFHYKTFGKDELYVGKLLSFDQIKFKDSDTEFKPGSEKALDSVYKFLVKNPTIKIEIQGHVNSSGGNDPVQIPGKPSYTNLQLSQQRAVAIYNFLVGKGIAPERMTTVGYGSTRMKFPNPQNMKERIANVRAEILIVSLDYKKDNEQTKGLKKKN